EDVGVLEKLIPPIPIQRHAGSQGARSRGQLAVPVLVEVRVGLVAPRTVFIDPVEEGDVADVDPMHWGVPMRRDLTNEIVFAARIPFRVADRYGRRGMSHPRGRRCLP